MASRLERVREIVHRARRLDMTVPPVTSAELREAEELLDALIVEMEPCEMVALTLEELPALAKAERVAVSVQGSPRIPAIVMSSASEQDHPVVQLVGGGRYAPIHAKNGEVVVFVERRKR